MCARAEDALNACYCHTPMRYAWLPDTDVGSENGAISRLGLRALRGRLRRIDLAASRGPDAYAANSTTVRDRIRAFYGRDATVIHPPVEVGDFDPRPARRSRDTSSGYTGSFRTSIRSSWRKPSVTCRTA